MKFEINKKLIESFENILAYSYRLFQAKNVDYGPTWLLYRYHSLNDEIWRKANRIRTLEEHLDQACILEGRDVEYIGIINYCIMFLIKLDATLELPSNEVLREDISALDAINEDLIFEAYQNKADNAKSLMIKKNTDYGDAWKSMTLGSMTDQVIIRAYRIRKMLSNNGKCIVSEGICGQLYDIINYCVFALIKMDAVPVNIIE